MKLEYYLNTNSFFENDYITLLRMEQLMKYMQTVKPNILYNSLDSKIDISKIDAKYSVLLSSNPDMDFPRPTEYIRSNFNDNTPFDYNKQMMLENMKYTDKIETSQLQNIPEHIKKIYCHSVGLTHEKVIMVPIGRDFKNETFFNFVDSFIKTEKSILCYYNVTIPPPVYHWYGFVRKHIYDIMKHKSFVFCKKCDVHPRRYSQDDIITYYQDLAKSKFMICPRGCGIDTYRLWDSIHMGCIPIVEKFDGYLYYQDLPIFFIDSWKELDTMTSEFLENKWNEMKIIDYNYDKMRISYWYNIFLQEM